MSDLAHERDRLVALVDEWIADREQDQIENAQIDHVVLAAVLIGDGEGQRPVVAWVEAGGGDVLALKLVAPDV
jgi:hypothetical protein